LQIRAPTWLSSVPSAIARIVFARPFFKPSDSYYNFGRLADPEDIARDGPLSQSPSVKHGNTGDTGDYPPEEVAQMAHSDLRVIKDSRQRRLA
jgi:hypothetical protein